MIAEIELVKTEKNPAMEELLKKLKTILTREISYGLSHENEDIRYNFYGMLDAIDEFQTNLEMFVKECKNLETVPKYVREEAFHRGEKQGMENAKYSK